MRSLILVLSALLAQSFQPGARMGGRRGLRSIAREVPASAGGAGGTGCARPWRRLASADDSTDAVSDEELLQQMRAEKQRNQDSWQLSIFRKEHEGTWSGECQIYEPDAEGALVDRGSVPVQATVEADWEKGVVAVAERIEGPGVAPKLQTAVRERFSRSELRPECGNMAVGKCYTLWSGEGEEVAVEVGIASGTGRRLRCKALYAASDGGLALSSVLLCRERNEAAAASRGPLDGDEELYGSIGDGLYDPPQTGSSPYASLYVEGRVTLRLPLSVGGEPSVNAISLDWAAKDMRYQADRKFRTMGPISSLELVEIGTENSKIYAPDW